MVEVVHCVLRAFCLWLIELVHLGGLMSYPPSQHLRTIQFTDGNFFFFFILAVATLCFKCFDYDWLKMLN